ncbi:hypothetical protein M432DRAFT_278487 [Thermoascus aurantiacus ATCC 26904]
MNATASLDPAPQLPRPSRHVPLPLMLDNCIRPPPLLLLPGPGLAWPCPWTSDAAIPLVTTSGPALLLFLSAQGLLVETPAVEHLARTVEHFFFKKKRRKILRPEHGVYCIMQLSLLAQRNAEEMLPRSSPVTMVWSWLAIIIIIMIDLWRPSRPEQQLVSVGATVPAPDVPACQTVQPVVDSLLDSIESASLRPQQFWFRTAPLPSLCVPFDRVVPSGRVFVPSGWIGSQARCRCVRETQRQSNNRQHWCTEHAASDHPVRCCS